ncbi:MAG: TlpA disulfide reductase family protein [Cyclobacteriaceae bacterium]
MILLTLILSELTHAQTYDDDFWSNPNVIWKTGSGTIITSSFARKMYTQGNYKVVERDLRGGRLEVTMIRPPKVVKEVPANIDWNDPNLVVKDDSGQVLPKGMSELLLRIKSIEWEINKLETGITEVVFKLGASQKWKSAWAESNVEYVRDWVHEWRGKPLPDFKLTDIDGEVVDNSIGKGKILVFNFWNSGCGRCIKEMEQLNLIVEAFYDEEVVFLAPNYELAGSTGIFLERQRFNYRVLTNAQGFMDDLQLDYQPTHMIVDQEGTILDINVGSVSNIGEEIGKRLSYLLTSNTAE